ncbi:WD repeat domain-containing protein [Phlyctema vagabunda]|uniref:WD repeat domain-containing protein n=1 Tax=Phlyctema vagabunda TaxID=108571 RepID=A0ABR4P6N4_9HELO
MTLPASPYQCLHRCGDGPVLVAASASRLDSFNLDDGSLLSSWESCSPQDQHVKNNDTSVNANARATPPAKRRKLSDVQERVEAGTVMPANAQPGHKKVNARSSAASSGPEGPAVIALASTKTGTHVIAVTGEDKSIRVFQHDGRGHLLQLSQRAMPKRPCALAITDDDLTIISADKFGDVYSLPLIVPGDDITGIRTSSDTPLIMSISTPQPFTPAANDLTVHSVRNRKALENQKRQTNRPAEKLAPEFEHTLLLGHVSMLTDIALSTLDGKGFIITADRDEHIRVSRGMPQTHVIESFCLGHTEFISRLCLVEGRPEILISGGGDDALFVWDWHSGHLISKAELNVHLAHALEMGISSTDMKKPTISGLLQTKLLYSEAENDTIIAICEGVPILLVFTLTSEEKLVFCRSYVLPGNPLCLVASEAHGANILVSIDTIHKPGSTTVCRDATEPAPDPLVQFALSGDALTRCTTSFAVPRHTGKEQSSQWTSLLYNIENFRKRDGINLEDE